jgi:hypothetical protein
MEKGIVWISFDIMEQFMVDVFKGLGVPEADARVCAEVLITADKRGIDSHGVARLKTIYYDRIREGIQHPVTEFSIVKEGPTTAVVDGHDGMGHVIAKRAMRMTIDKAKKYGMGMVAVRNSTHYGIAGYYAMMAAKEGMIGITGTNARPSVAPTFGVENMLGTNPLTFGMPTDEEFPFVREFTQLLSMPVIIESGGTRGQMFVEANHRGIPAVIIELTGGGAGGIIDIPASEEAFSAVTGMMRLRGFIPGETPKPQPGYYGKLVGVRVPQDGVFMPAVSAGQAVRAGQALGFVDGAPLASPVDGMAVIMRPASYVFKGMPLLLVAGRKA